MDSTYTKRINILMPLIWIFQNKMHLIFYAMAKKLFSRKIKFLLVSSLFFLKKKKIVYILYKVELNSKISSTVAKYY